MKWVNLEYCVVIGFFDDKWFVFGKQKGKFVKESQK
jgi:hypothetical protein